MIFLIFGLIIINCQNYAVSNFVSVIFKTKFRYENNNNSDGSVLSFHGTGICAE
ncbi:protein of unknown function [Chryseobacterium sp. JV274]|nr:protein of unknown function [Chryseobacterium sp. JV274]